MTGHQPELGFGLISCQRHPADARSWTDLYAQAVRLAVRAEELGLASVWTTEHHFVDDGYLPSLLPVCAALAARTSRIRVGTGVLLAPLHHPLRLAEDAACVGLLSGGRLILGLGLGWSEVEFRALGVDRLRRGRAMTETLRILAAAWSGEVVDHRGELYRVPGVAIRPVPEEPIPIWIGGNADPAVRRAVYLADGFLSNAPVGRLERQVEVARREMESIGRDPASFRWSYYRILYPCDDPDRGWEEVRPYVWYMSWKYSDMEASARRGPGPLPEPPDLDRATEDRLRRNVLVGPAERLAEEIRAIEERVGVDLHFICRSYFPGMAPGSQEETLERIGEELLPLL